MFDCHVHSKYSIDSKMSMFEACETAISLGLNGIAFTDHTDYDYPEIEEPYNIDYKEYFSEIETIIKKYKNRLNVLKAIEIGIQPHVIKKSLELLNAYPFDYVLASVHIIDGLDPYVSGYYPGKTLHDAYERYLKEIYFMITNFNNYDMVGHFEYIIRYAPYADRTLKYADFTDIFDSILKELVRQGRGFELNTGTFRKPSDTAEYDAEVLKRYRELGGDLVSLGSDGHRSDHIGLRFDYFSQVLKNTGFKYTVHYEDRKPVYDKL